MPLLLEDLKPDCTLHGIHPSESVTVISTKWHGTNALTLLFRRNNGKVDERLLFRDDEKALNLVAEGRPWDFDGDGQLYRLVSEAQRIRLAHLFDPMLAVHTSLIDPLPHQITAVYETMLSKHPLRFLLADDPGAGKTIMAGLLIKELIARGDLVRCLVVCPGSLVEQWQDELYRRFGLDFEIMTNDKIESARTGNWFLENNLAIARLDKLARDEDLQLKLRADACRYDLVICDEAHKMSASFFGREIRYTKRYRLGQLLSGLTRHLLLMTATPHNGKEEDFQLFLALLDADRFEGRFRDGVHRVDVSDIMRRMVKENLLKFDGRPLFPERIAYTVPFRLTESERELYSAVTEYVREEFNRADALQNERRAGNVGFALTVLQRRLASSPEAILQSLTRRKDKLANRLEELRFSQNNNLLMSALRSVDIDLDELQNLDDAPQDEVDETEQTVVDEATAASTMSELETEIESLGKLQQMAARIRRSGEDTKWRELASVITQVFSQDRSSGELPDDSDSDDSGRNSRSVGSSAQKLVIFTEHRDTLNYLARRIDTLLGRAECVVQIHGGMGRAQRRLSQDSFVSDPEVQILLATDAAGEGINLQRAHLMVNYDLPWNPNRIEQRFGRIHRIGQTEVCHLWNLVAEGTREGDVYKRLFEKLEQARTSLGGQVFDVLGKLEFEGRNLRDLLIEAIRYGDRPEIRSRLTQSISDAVDLKHLRDLMEERSLVHDAMDTSQVTRAREDLERAEARRLQPHFVESFFLDAFRRLGGTVREREKQRYQINHVPVAVRNHGHGIAIRDAVLQRYERIAFEKSLLSYSNRPPAAFVCPGHPLLSAVLDLTLERHGDVLKRGAVLVDDCDSGETPRILLALESEIHDAGDSNTGLARVISKRVLYVEIDKQEEFRQLGFAPYLDYRPLGPDDPTVNQVLELPELRWIDGQLEEKAQESAIEYLVPEHLKEIKSRTSEWVDKTRAAVKDRLTKEITHWFNRAEQLRLQELRGKAGARLNSQEARRRAEELEKRLSQRMSQLEREIQISALPPVILAGALIVPSGLIARMTGINVNHAIDTQDSAARAREIVMLTERKLGFEPTDRELERLGYDIESRDPKGGSLRFIEVKGRNADAKTVTVTRNEIHTALNEPEKFILAIVLFIEGNKHLVRYIRQPFEREPDLAVASINYKMSELLQQSDDPS